MIDTNDSPWQRCSDTAEIMPLHGFGDERVMLFRLSAHEPIGPHEHSGGEVFYVISGEARDEHGRYPAGTWVRSPDLSRHSRSAEEEAVLWIKIGHLPMAPDPDPGV